ncbi:MAG: hypothetical protein A2017_17700 [Lentisphaerae bacterium GWF2_44_16]|nr:MAG: hypothetical protein A2017_17700 [Lentisphaerae bacterium GWF2_44_16]HAU65844.1 hypothetical protein [Candidatus Uhrbacteria bacterium]
MVIPFQKNKQEKILSITCDSSANKKTLCDLEKRGFIKIFDVNIETFSKQTTKIKAVAVRGHSKWDDGSVWGDDSNNFQEAKEIIGGHNMGDVRHLEAHLRSGNDVFVTEDLDEFIRDGRREELESKFSDLKIMTPEELKNLLLPVEEDV